MEGAGWARSGVQQVRVVVVSSMQRCCISLQKNGGRGEAEAGLKDRDGEARWNGSRWRRPGTGRGRGSDGDKLEASAMGAPRRAVAVAVS